MIRFLLFYRLEWCEQRPGLMFAALGVVLMVAGALEEALP
jgi:hypothetical protein